MLNPMYVATRCTWVDFSGLRFRQVQASASALHTIHAVLRTGPILDDMCVSHQFQLPPRFFEIAHNSSLAFQGNIHYLTYSWIFGRGRYIMSGAAGETRPNQLSDRI